MTNPEHREKIARDALVWIVNARVAFDAHPVGVIESMRLKAVEALAAIIALDPAPESGDKMGLDTIDTLAYTPRPAPDVEQKATFKACNNCPGVNSLMCCLMGHLTATLAWSSGS